MRTDWVTDVVQGLSHRGLQGPGPVAVFPEWAELWSHAMGLRSISGGSRGAHVAGVCSMDPAPLQGARSHYRLLLHLY